MQDQEWRNRPKHRHGSLGVILDRHPTASSRTEARIEKGKKTWAALIVTWSCMSITGARIFHPRTDELNLRRVSLGTIEMWKKTPNFQSGAYIVYASSEVPCCAMIKADNSAILALSSVTFSSRPVSLPSIVPRG